MTSPRLIGVVTNYGELVDAFRARKAEIAISDLTLDSLAGWPAGWCGKVLGPAQSKTLGFLSFFNGLQALGLAVHIVEDKDLTARLRSRWEKKDVTRATMLDRLSIKAISKFVPIVAREMSKRAGSKGGRNRAAKLSPARRRAIARKGGIARWKRRRSEREARRALREPVRGAHRE